MYNVIRVNNNYKLLLILRNQLLFLYIKHKPLSKIAFGQLKIRIHKSFDFNVNASRLIKW